LTGSRADKESARLTNLHPRTATQRFKALSQELPVGLGARAADGHLCAAEEGARLLVPDDRLYNHEPRALHAAA
jgi:hypothetical protein